MFDDYPRLDLVISLPPLSAGTFETFVLSDSDWEERSGSEGEAAGIFVLALVPVKVRFAEIVAPLMDLRGFVATQFTVSTQLPL